MFHNVYRPKVSDPGPSWPSCYRVKQRQLHKFKYNFGNHQANFIWKIPPTHQIKIACRSSPPYIFYPGTALSKYLCLFELEF